MNKYQNFFNSIGLVDSEGLAKNYYDEDDISQGHQFLARVRSKRKNSIDCSLETFCEDAVQKIQKTTKIKPIIEKNSNSKFWIFKFGNLGDVIVEKYKNRSNYMTIMNNK